jgi:hypothetical protein
MESEWAETLLEIYKNCRSLPRWDLVYSCHDKEDQDYFDMLDENRKTESVAA